MHILKNNTEYHIFKAEKIAFFYLGQKKLVKKTFYVYNVYKLILKCIYYGDGRVFLEYFLRICLLCCHHKHDRSLLRSCQKKILDNLSENRR